MSAHKKMLKNKNADVTVIVSGENGNFKGGQ
jgi:hypothetical protein